MLCVLLCVVYALWCVLYVCVMLCVQHGACCVCVCVCVSGRALSVVLCVL